jgi:hypothetical protein
MDAVDLSAILKKVVPFGAPGAPAGSSAAASEPSRGTVAFAVPPLPTPAGPVPFAQKASDQAAIESARRHAEEVQGPAKSGASFAGATVDGFDLASILKRPVPFGPGAASSPPVSAGASAPVAPSPPVAPVAPSTSVRPFTLEQYASLCEDIAFSGGHAAEVLARYGITEAERRALDDHWTALFQKQPMTFLSWQSARATYRAWVRKQRGT